jgi:hypothetical protein
VTVGRRCRWASASAGKKVPRALNTIPKKFADVRSLFALHWKNSSLIYTALTTDITTSYENSAELIDKE